MTQNEALDILKSGANVFLTGEPGSGKTYAVNSYVKYLRERSIQPSVTASTGIAATHINGVTIHSWSGIGIKRFLSEYDLDRITQNRRVFNRVRGASVLIIDEISMLSKDTFAMVDAVCRKIRGDARPLGGLQVVAVGDFFQLPPVHQRTPRETDAGELFAINLNLAEFTFFSPVWDALNFLTCYLSEQYRQDDAVFLGMLSAIRRGDVSDAHRKLFMSKNTSTAPENLTQLFSHNADVDRINSNKLAKLLGPARNFEMESRGPEALLKQLKKSCLSPETLVLKTGASVMFTKNDIEHRFVNGTLGVVTGFDKEGGESLPIVKTNSGKIIFTGLADWHIEENGRVLARVTQIPLRLAWAITVHKSQGMSLDAAHMDLSDAFEYGQGYVALSRVRALSGLSLAGLNERALEVHPKVRAKDEEFREASEVAREAFAKFSSAELAKMHNNFTRARGGKNLDFEKVFVEDKKTRSK